MNLRKLIEALVFFVASGFSFQAVADNDRWYQADQVQTGQQLFTDNCAVCHGGRAEATSDWKKRGEDGHYPPPPLNGSAHAWHHPLEQLRRTIQRGGKPLGGVMPAFKEKLNQQEIDQVIAYFQSMWTDEIYTAWKSRHTGDQLQELKNLTSASTPNVTRYLSTMVSGAGIDSLEATPIKNLQQVKVGKDFIYLTADGRYALTGDLIDLKDGQNLTELARNLVNLELLRTFPESDMLVYQAKGTERSVITVFTDTSCPYCQKLHSDIPQLSSAGVTVRYIPFPRGGTSGEGFKDLTSIWCADNPLRAMDIAQKANSGELENKTCGETNVINAGYQLGVDIGIRGTPALILQGGRKIEGYLRVDQLIKSLGLTS